MFEKSKFLFSYNKWACWLDPLLLVEEEEEVGLSKIDIFENISSITIVRDKASIKNIIESFLSIESKEYLDL